MVLVWIAGVLGLSTGVGTAAYLRSGTMPDMTTAAAHAGTMADVLEYGELQRLRAMLALTRVTFPLAIAEVLLSGLLVVACALAMNGRRGSRALALQAILANALLAIAAFALTPSMRTAYFDGILHAVGTVTLPPPQHEMLTNPGFIHWIVRIKLAMFLGVMGLGVVALTRARTRTYFEVMARATESREEP